MGKKSLGGAMLRAPFGANKNKNPPVGGGRAFAGTAGLPLCAAEIEQR